MDEKSTTIIENYDKCLNLIGALKNQINHDEVDAAEVCGELVNSYNIYFDSFRHLPLLWNHLLVSRISQLLLLAKNCYPDHESSTLTLTLAHWSAQHATLAEKLREHFSSVETSLKWSSPTIPLDALIGTLNENAKCTAEQIPTAVTAIMHDYCYIDPFSFDDAELIKVKLVALGEIEKIKT